MAAMIYRGKDVGIFSEWQARDAFKKLSAAGMRTKENEPVPVEISFIHKMIFESFAKNNITPDQYARQLWMNTSSLAELMPSAREFLPKYPEGRVIEKRHMKLIS